MKSNLEKASQNFIQGMSRISNFWGFPRAMGAIYGAIYLSPTPLSLDEIVEQVGVTKGAVSTNVRQLERLGMVHKHILVGDRKDYYQAETDFWKMIKGILQEREKSEFDLALTTVSDSLALAEAEDQELELAAFYRERIGAMQTFFNTLDSLVGTILKLESLVSLSAFRKFLEKSTQ
jgi:DNA-binding transcriptional regulator GbsR (MarR family)